MKVLQSLKNVTPLSGCTISDLEFALKRSEYADPNLLHIVRTSVEESYKRTSAQNALTFSLFLMCTHAVFVDFSKRMVIVETADSKEFSVYYYNSQDLERNLCYIFQSININFSLDANEFVSKIKDALYLHRTETDYQKLWSYLVDLSIVYFDKT